MNLSKAQGAIEYLLIIGAGIIVVAIVISALVSISSQQPDSKNHLDNSYGGILDIYDNANNQARIILRFIGDQNNPIRFSDEVNKTIDELFRNLPIGSTIRFNNPLASEPCINVDIEKIDQGWDPQDQADCEIPANTEITIKPTEDTEIEIITPVETETEFYFNADSFEDLGELTIQLLEKNFDEKIFVENIKPNQKTIVIQDSTKTKNISNFKGSFIKKDFVSNQILKIDNRTPNTSLIEHFDGTIKNFRILVISENEIYNEYKIIKNCGENAKIINYYFWICNNQSCDHVKVGLDTLGKSCHDKIFSEP